MKLVLLLSLFLLCGCAPQPYTISQYIEDTKALFFIEGDIQTTNNLDETLRCNDVVDIVLELLHEDDIEYLYALACVDETMVKENVVISKQKADEINQIVYDNLHQQTFYETKVDMDEIIPTDNLENISPGIYEYEGDIYEVTDRGEIKEYDPKTFEIESTFTPNLQESIILPEGSSVLPSGTSFQSHQKVDFLSSNYFRFNLNGYTVSGRVQKDSLQVKVSKKTDSGVKIENDLTIDQLKLNVDLSLEKKDFYFRADYRLKDEFSISKEKTIRSNQLPLTSFEKLKTQLSQMKNSPLVEDELHLLTFAFEIPQTGKLVKVIMDLSLKLMANGEAKVTFSTIHNQGSQSFKDTVNHLNQQKWEIKPHIEGNIECASNLSFGLQLGQVKMADFALQGGIGAEATSQLHYVDTKKKLVETTSSTIDLISMEELLSQYDKLGEKYVDVCADVNVYAFARVQANQKSCLLRKLGLYGSMTPFKNNFSLLHIENHSIVDSCTKREILFNPENDIDVFDLSNYQLQLTPNKTIQLTSSKEKCSFESTNPEVVSVNQNGQITAHQVGYGTIIVRDETGVERRCLVFVQEGNE